MFAYRFSKPAVPWGSQEQGESQAEQDWLEAERETREEQALQVKVS